MDMDDGKIVPVLASEENETDCEDVGMAVPVLLAIGVIAALGVYHSLFGGDDADRTAVEPAPVVNALSATTR